jgi:hypothetical protein
MIDPDVKGIFSIMLLNYRNDFQVSIGFIRKNTKVEAIFKRFPNALKILQHAAGDLRSLNYFKK